MKSRAASTRSSSDRHRCKLIEFFEAARGCEIAALAKPRLEERPFQHAQISRSSHGGANGSSLVPHATPCAFKAPRRRLPPPPHVVLTAFALPLPAPFWSSRAFRPRCRNS